MTFSPQPKREYVRSEAWQSAVRSLSCQNCGNGERSQSSHPNWSWSGKGKSIKGDDLTAAICVYCHSEIDQGKNLSGEERELFWLRAFYKTVRALFLNGVLRIGK